MLINKIIWLTYNKVDVNKEYKDFPRIQNLLLQLFNVKFPPDFELYLIAKV